MSSTKTDKQFLKMVIEIKQDQNVLAFWLDGSRGKGMVTKNSDYDGVIIVKDSVIKEYRKKYASKINPDFDFKVWTLDELRSHAEYSTPMTWDRYNFAHLKVMFDRTGKIQKIIDNKPKLSKKEQRETISNALGAFINQVYRLEKNLRDGDMLSAKLDAIEGIPFFIEAIFALEGRVRPYNKYLAWELDNYPLQKFPWKKGELVKILSNIIDKNKLHALLQLLITIRPIFQKAGYTKEFSEWNGYFKVGDQSMRK